MDIRVSGHQVDTGAALQAHAADRLNAIVDKYFNRALSSQVTLGKGPHDSFTVDIVTHVMQGLIVKGHAEAQDAHQAVDKAAEKIDKQLRRYKRRLKDRHEQSDYAVKQEEAAYIVFQGATEDEEAESVEADAPPIIAETRTDIPEASVSDAVMMLDLRDTPALFFKNAGTGRHNMVYRRNDGTIGWVEPSIK
ncbi:ribosome hibernation-promoting factor, HPF/YfiA family [Croceicoccus sp. BE223]|uniref:ribosome hibernation-promoting factor, HPF/YfiA family n=1 Tax=Croceicoccus sp. BE223 TaxID=2817716 RepID=UPI00286792DF|nr:ribosome-associated translation inhibitor RaiA [Croceicoccus sp. BE223]MDR7102165.1 ribosomal subunit interface protein [Croceicoccus sp. BE223]